MDDGLTLDFGGLAVQVESSDKAWRQLAAERWRGFSMGTERGWTRKRPSLRVVYRVVDRRTPSPRALEAARRAPLRTDPAAPTEIVGVGFRGRFEPRPGVDLEVEGIRALAPLDRLLQLLWTRHRRGLILHGAALVEPGGARDHGDRRGWLCTGPSGVGKSTLAGLFPHHALCDELTAVRVEQGDVPRIDSLPFWRGRPGSAPLAGIHLLRHGASHRRHRLSPRQALAALRTEVSWPVPDRDAVERALDALTRLVRAVPVWRLEFRPDRDVWHELTREAA
ncbi:MAG: hypothetical protein AAGC60_17660 [Acidobacteriota bacterium]